SVEGYDGYTTCSKPLRAAKTSAEFPCDFSTQTWCTIPGSYYPWRAVRRFVYENHGLMRRMYGDERHISVLRSEIESNDVEYHAQKWTSSAASIDPNNANTFKHYKLKKEEYKTSSSSSSSAKTTTTTSTLRTTTVTLTSAKVEETTTDGMRDEVEDDDPSTTLFTDDVESTTFGYDAMATTTLSDQTGGGQASGSTSQPPPPSSSDPAGQEKIQIFQDTLEKTQSTTEEQQILYKTKGVNACPVKEEVVAPFWANNTRGEVLALLNLYPFEQYVHWERCTYENRQMFCRQGCRCEQQYRLHRLLAYDPTNDCRGIFSDWFKFPSCCVCKCYDLPTEFRLTSRSPRNGSKRRNYT
ncbi:hypothetical protein AAG570_003552, partial [Ranatra chinensis]